MPEKKKFSREKKDIYEKNLDEAKILKDIAAKEVEEKKLCVSVLNLNIFLLILLF